MIKNFLLFLFATSLLFISACEKPEKLWDPVKVPEGIQTQTFGLGENYENQIWFNIQDQKIWVNRHDIWDIAFASGPGNEIKINGGLNQYFSVATIDVSNYNALSKIKIDQIPLDSWKFDNPSGEGDSQVFYQWCDGTGNAKNRLYVIDRGDDNLGNKRYVEMILHGRSGGNYHFTWNYALDTPMTKHDVYVNPDPAYNFAYYSFSKADTVMNELTNNLNWDLVFTTYKKFIPDPANGNKPYPYVLRGVLYNTAGVKVYDVPNVGPGTWDQINMNFAKALTFSSVLDEIGYDWKIWNMSANKYTMSNKIYVIKDMKDNYFKLKFVDFYDDNGRKGYPKMAWELLK